MNEPTPRTDAAEFDRDEDCSIPDDMIVTADFARTLERELAQVKSNFLEIQKTCHNKHTRLEKTEAELAQVRAERDDLLGWQEKWRKATSESDKRTNDLFVSMSSQLDRAFTERDAALAQVARANEAVTYWDARHSEAMQTINTVVPARDAALAQVAKLRESSAKLIDAIRSVQDWNETYVGECIDEIEALAATKGDE